MIEISDMAYDQIMNTINGQDKKDLFLRVYITSDMAWGMALDNRKSDDDSGFKHKELYVRIDRITMPYLSNCRVDFIEQNGSTGFQVINDTDMQAGMGGGGCGSCSGGAGCC